MPSFFRERISISKSIIYEMLLILAVMIGNNRKKNAESLKDHTRAYFYLKTERYATTSK